MKGAIVMGYTSLLWICVSASTGRSGLVAKKDTCRPALSTRGGGSSMVAHKVVHVATAVSLLYGGVNYLAPEATSDICGVEPTPTETALMRRVGLAAFGIGFLPYAVFIKDVSVEKANGMYAALWVIEHSLSLLNKDSVMTVGPSTAQMIVGLLFVIAANTSVAPISSKVLSVLGILSGIQLVFTPVSSLRLLTRTNGNASELSMTRDLGLWLTSLGVLQATLAFGMDPIKALGYSQVAVLLRTLAAIFGTNEVQKAGIQKALQYFWLSYHTVIATLLFI